MICATCEHAIFDAKWGDYKCDKSGLVYIYLHACDSYKEGTPKESKKNEDYYLEQEDN